MAQLELYPGIIFTIPTAPPKAEIINGWKTKKDQRWERYEIPMIALPTGTSIRLDEIDPQIVEELYESEHEDVRKFIDEDNARCTNGVWFMNNGTATYITGYHYEYLQWYSLDVGAPFYSDKDRRWYYFTQLCFEDMECMGELYGKKRRDGFSHRCMSITLASARKTFNAEYGMMSKTGGDAKELFAKLIFAFKKYPSFYKPQVASAEDIQKELFFKEPSKRISHKNRRTVHGVSLETKINWRNTRENSYDGLKVKVLSGDECFHPDTKILCEGYVFRKISDIKIGDKVIVEGGDLKKVYKTFRGEDEMFLIHQPYAKDYIVSAKHRLVLEQRIKKDSTKDDGEKLYTPPEFIALMKNRKKLTYATRASMLPMPAQQNEIPPYLFGLWIGDGVKSNAKIVCNPVEDPEVVEYIYAYAKENNYNVSVDNISEKCHVLGLIMKLKGRTRENPFVKELKRLKCYKNKHIPKGYLVNSEENRLQLLAGIIDSDGYYSDRGFFEIGMSKKNIIEDIYFLSKSLGFSVSEIKESKSNFKTNVYKICISGEAWRIPTKVKRKRDTRRKLKYKFRKNRIEVHPIGIGKYVGIQLFAFSDNERKLILEDFTLSMNCAKLEKDVSFRKWLAVASTCLTQGRKIIGKALMGSSVEEAEKGGKEFKEVWMNSNPLERDLNGRTISGLYRYFTPAEDGLEGFIDEYGMSVMETPAKPVMGIDGQLIKIGAIEYLENVLKSKKEAGDMIGYYEAKRQFPRTEADMFLDPKNETASLPVEKIYQQIEINNGFPTLPIRQGNFQWKDGLQDTYVVFHDDPKGRWLVYWMPKPEDRSKWVLLRGLKSPSFKDFGCFGLDPYDHKLTSEGKGSNAASHGYRKFDHMDPLFSDIFVTEYLARPMDPYEMYEDILMQCVFYGWPVLGESNKPGCMTYFENRGYFNYLMMRPAATHTDWSEENQESPWIPTTGDAVRNSLVSYLRAYIYQKIGLNEQTKKPGNMVFNRTLQDWLVFKGEGQWTDWDLTVSTMLAIAGSLDYKPKKKEVKNMQFFPVFGKDGRQINPHSDRPVSDNPLVVPFGR